MGQLCDAKVIQAFLDKAVANDIVIPTELKADLKTAKGNRETQEYLEQIFYRTPSLPKNLMTFLPVGQFTLPQRKIMVDMLDLLQFSKPKTSKKDQMTYELRRFKMSFRLILENAIEKVLLDLDHRADIWGERMVLNSEEQQKVVLALEGIQKELRTLDQLSWHKYQKYFTGTELNSALYNEEIDMLLDELTHRHHLRALNWVGAELYRHKDQCGLVEQKLIEDFTMQVGHTAMLIHQYWQSFQDHPEDVDEHMVWEIDRACNQVGKIWSGLPFQGLLHRFSISRENMIKLN